MGTLALQLLGRDPGAAPVLGTHPWVPPGHSGAGATPAAPYGHPQPVQPPEPSLGARGLGAGSSRLVENFPSAAL